jgi:hypothetical protein
VAAVQSWYNEISKYNWSAPASNANANNAGHFSQLVWVGTTNFGAGVCTTKSSSGWLYVTADYNPAGNNYGYDTASGIASFNQNVLQPTCTPATALASATTSG